MSKKKKRRSVVGMVLAVIVIIVGIFILLTQPKKVEYTYEPVTDIAQIRECVKKVTGSSRLDIEALSQDQALLSDVYRFCLKTVEDIEATLAELAQ